MVSREQDLWQVVVVSLAAHHYTIAVRCQGNGPHIASLQRFEGDPGRIPFVDLVDDGFADYATGASLLEAAFAAEQRFLVEEVGDGAARGTSYAEKAANRLAQLDRDRAAYWTEVYARGRVKFYLAEEGWGAIESDATPGDAFLHYTAIAMPGFRLLEAGDPVEFRFDSAAPGQDGCAYRATWARRL